MVSPKEVDESTFLFGVQPYVDQGCLDELPSFSLKVSMQTSLVGFTLDWLGFFAGISISN